MKKLKIISAMITVVILISTFAVSANAAESESEPQVIITPYEDLWKEPIEVEAGTPIEWYVSLPEGTELKGCGATVKIPGYEAWTDDFDKTQNHIVLAEGNNLIYKFDTLEPGDILFACWMGSGCHKNYIHVTEKSSAVSTDESLTKTEQSSVAAIEESPTQTEESSATAIEESSTQTEGSADTDVEGIAAEDSEVSDDSEDPDNSESSEPETDDTVSTTNKGQTVLSDSNSGTSSVSSAGSTESLPKTGDDSFAVVWIFAAVSAAAVIFAAQRKKNEI